MTPSAIPSLAVLVLVLVVVSSNQPRCVQLCTTLYVSSYHFRFSGHFLVPVLVMPFLVTAAGRWSLINMANGPVVMTSRSQVSFLLYVWIFWLMYYFIDWLLNTYFGISSTAGRYETSPNVKLTGFTFAVLTTCRTVHFAVTVPPSIPPVSILRPDIKLENAWSLTISYDLLESGKKSPYQTAKSKAEVVRYLL